MTGDEFQKKYAAVVPGRDITTDEGLKAAAIIVEQAAKEGVEYAIAGGIAMHIFGYLRATHDVDLLASKMLDLPYEEKLSFGGVSHHIPVGERKIIVDVIVRDDLYRNYYEAALRDAYWTKDGWRVVSPEWMVILKYMAARSKDLLDLLWMLRQPGLVNRDKVAKLFEEILGELGADAALKGLGQYYVQAEIMKSGDENGRQER